ncbi:MAG: dTDP-4-dehydrorhamnose reductase, partial [Candidatus Aenigmarchaeota archaeon]|nr:dTDP-4-dehydrorhamnose reductase [Candidatus Aenigmarchaeota archaeon]
MEKILVTGGAGLLGSKLIKLGSKDFEIIACYNRNKPGFGNIQKMDVIDRERVLEVVEKEKPDTIVHTAALTNVDYCEDHGEDAWKINVEGTRNIIEAAKRVNTKIVYVSTEYVFDGEHGPYSEDDETSPLGIYAKTKLKGEEAVKDSGLDYMIIRTTVLYGIDKYKHNFVTWVIENLRNNEEIRVVTDQYGSPSFADGVARIIIELIKNRKRGIYNVVGSDMVNRYEFALKIARVFNLNPKLIKPVTTEELKQKSPRPKNAGLKTDKI